MPGNTTQNVNYPWKSWADGRTWILKKGTQFAGSRKSFIHAAQTYATAVGLKCEARSRNNHVILRFFKPVR